MSQCRPSSIPARRRGQIAGGWPAIALVVAVVAANLLLLVLATRFSRVHVEMIDDRFVVGQWLPLDVRGYIEGTSGFRAPGQSDLPLIDHDPNGEPVLLGGRGFDSVLGLYPYGEAVYPLGGGYDTLQATVAAVPRPWQTTGAARLVLYGDGALLYDSGPLQTTEEPREVRVSVNGIRELRAVAVAEDSAEPAIVYLGDPQLLRALVVSGDGGDAPARDAMLLATRQQHARQRLAAELDRAGTERARAVRRWRISRGPTDNVVAGRLSSGTLAITTPSLAVTVETAGAASGTLEVIDLGHGGVVASGVRPAVVLADGTTVTLADLVPGEPLQEPAEVVGLGSGRALVVPFQSPAGDLSLTLEVTLVPGSRAALVQLVADQPVERFHLLDGAEGGLLVGDEPRYITDFSRPREGLIRDDGLVRSELLALGAPVFVWSPREDTGAVLAVLDETELPPRFDASRAPGDLRVRVTLATPPLERPGALAGTRSPRLYIEPTETADMRGALASFRALSLAQHPAPPMPDWVRHQWGSWYVYGTAIDEWKLREQIDYIADYLSDVGPWHVLLDAGWFIAEGRPGAELGRVDTEKFPSGIRALVDYAHARGIRMIFYYSAPYVDTKAVVSEWLALPGFIERHRDWLIPLGSEGGQESFAYDFSNPGLQQYMRDLLRRYYLEWNADGLLIDMLGHTEGAALNIVPPDRFGVVRPALAQSLDIYRLLWEETQRLRPDAFLEGAWDTPLLARPYAHTWRFADDAPEFRSAYPFGGLVEHIDYAVLQHLMLGQRVHLGAVIGQPESKINQWWLGAGLALGSQVVLSLPFTVIAPAHLADYRPYLSLMRPFEGTTRLGEGLRPDTFATTVAGTTFLGVLNRERAERDIPVDLEELGLDPNSVYLAYDVELGKFFPARAGFVARLGGETFRLFVLRRETGVLWTTSSFAPRRGDYCLTLTLEGPPAVPGLLHAYAARPSAVYLDGRELAEDSRAGEGWHYDAATGALTVEYAHQRQRMALQVVC